MSKNVSRRQYLGLPDDESSRTPLLQPSKTSRSTPLTAATGTSNALAPRGGLQSSSVAYHTFQSPQLGNLRTKPKQPNRTTKISQKLKLFPEDGDRAFAAEDLDADVYTQLSQIPHGTARVEAERLNKMNKDELSRVTAYCTAS